MNHARYARRLANRALVALTVAIALTASAPAVTYAGAAAAVAQKPPTVVGKQCAGSKGVTVVVDFRNLHNEAGKVMNKVQIGCAKGAPGDGFAALAGAGFDVDPSSPFVCEIDDRPLPQNSMCASRGYWSYWHAERDGGWEYSGVGPGDWSPPAGSLEGWSWSPYDKDWDGPRVTPADLFGG